MKGRSKKKKKETEPEQEPMFLKPVSEAEPPLAEEEPAEEGISDEPAETTEAPEPETAGRDAEETATAVEAAAAAKEETTTEEAEEETVAPKLDFLPKKKPKKGKIALIIGIAAAVLLILAGVIYFAFFRTTAEPVTVTMVLRGAILDVVNSTGKVEPNATIPVSSPATDKITEIPVKESGIVSKGQVLLRLERHGNVLSPSYGIITELNVQIGEQVTGPPTTTPTITPTIPGLQTSSTTPTDQTQTPTQTPTQIQTLTQTTTGGIPTTLMTIADTSTMFIIASVDETDISKIKVAQKAEMILDAYPSKKIKGEVTEIGLVATATQTGGITFPVKIKVTEAKGVTMRIGMSADCNIIPGPGRHDVKRFGRSLCR
jgi:multidrug efflux pump subunit AcrA (membrane-fusion protein)